MKLTKEERARKAYFGGRSLYKWYEVNITDDSKEEASSDEVNPDSLENDDEEIDLDQTDLSDDDKDLVMSIMAKFKDAHQDSVDSLFTSGPVQSEEDLIASICAPKQSNVDSLVNQARNI